MLLHSFDDSILPPASAVHADHVPDCGKHSFRRGTHSAPPFGTSFGADESAELMSHQQEEVSGVAAAVAVAVDDDDDVAA